MRKDGEEIRKSSIIVSRCSSSSSSSRGSCVGETKATDGGVRRPLLGGRKGIWYGEIIGREEKGI